MYYSIETWVAPKLLGRFANLDNPGRGGKAWICCAYIDHMIR